MTCAYCKKDPGNKAGSFVWFGFQDADTGQYVCWHCQQRHYKSKFKKPKLRGLYSEMPVVENCHLKLF